MLDEVDENLCFFSRKILFEVCSFDEKYLEIFIKNLLDNVNLKYGRNYDIVYVCYYCKRLYINI